jgi:hypothetical protein
MTALVLSLRSANPVAGAAFLAGALALAGEMRRKAWQKMFDGYRPERHYMRGPGPKSREKARALLVETI